MAQVSGRVFISLGGQRIRSKEGASLETGGVKRTASKSDAGVDGFTEEVVEPKVECKINHTAKTKLADLHAFKGTMTFETDTGRVFTLIDSWSANPPKLEKGEVSLEYGAIECIED
ncbi:MAG: phage tail tube protein [Burkholderiaceae bacterium]|nr:phage tail tube protein [Burkholderiaceae bacterium]